MRGGVYSQSYTRLFIHNHIGAIPNEVGATRCREEDEFAQNFAIPNEVGPTRCCEEDEFAQNFRHTRGAIPDEMGPARCHAMPTLNCQPTRSRRRRRVMKSISRGKPFDLSSSLRNCNHLYIPEAVPPPPRELSTVLLSSFHVNSSSTTYSSSLPRAHPTQPRCVGTRFRGSSDQTSRNCACVCECVCPCVSSD